MFPAAVAAEPSRTLHYKRSHFATQLPVEYRYSPSHCWIAKQEDACWRVGFTKFAVRMLGEMVDHGFEIEPDATVAAGQIIGWVEGFKAISDVFSIAEGNFGGANSVLKERITLINKDPYGAGWLYMVRGQPDSRCVDVQEYRAILDKTIDKILEKQKTEEIK
jgi:glycine cleavage system H protein